MNATEEQVVRVSGVPGSPYTRKMLAALRYRRIPYRMVMRGGPEDAATPAPRVQLMPVIVLPGEAEARTDSTPILQDLDRRWADRRLVPADPALAFVDALIEDYGDEWLTKAMFHYRWAYAADIQRGAAILPRWSGATLPEEELEAEGRAKADLQISRLWVVGSNETTGPIIEASYERLLGILDRCLTGRRFVLGSRPTAGDFAIYGQLTQLALFDPTPMELTLERTPRVAAWTQNADDLSGLEYEGDGLDRLEELPPAVHDLLAEIGRVYAPFLVANADALRSGAEEVECTIDGARWVQRPFPYQGKCLAVLRQRYEALSASDRERVDAVLAGTGNEVLFGES